MLRMQAVRHSEVVEGMLAGMVAVGMLVAGMLAVEVGCMLEAEEFVAEEECMHRPLADRGISEATVEVFATLEAAVEVISPNGHRRIMRLPFRIQIREVFDRESLICQARAIIASATEQVLQEDCPGTGLVRGITASMDGTMLTSELLRFLLQIASLELGIANTTAIRSISTTDGSTSAATTTDPRITDMQAIMVTGMGIEVTESVRE